MCLVCTAKKKKNLTANAIIKKLQIFGNILKRHSSLEQKKKKKKVTAKAIIKKIQIFGKILKPTFFFGVKKINEDILIFLRVHTVKVNGVHCFTPQCSSIHLLLCSSE